MGDVVDAQPGVIQRGAAGHGRWPVSGAARRRADSGIMASDEAAASGNTHRSRAMPSRSASATDMSSRAAAWSTFHWEHSSLVYGLATMRLASVGSVMAAADGAERSHASGSAAATAAGRRGQPTQSSAPGRRRSSAVGVAQRALDHRVLVGGHGQIPLDLDGGEDVALGAPHLIGPVVLGGLRGGAAGDGRPQGPVLGLPTHHQDGVDGAGGDLGGGVRQQRLLEDADRRPARSSPPGRSAGRGAGRGRDRTRCPRGRAPARRAPAPATTRCRRRPPAVAPTMSSTASAARAGSSSCWVTRPAPTRTGVRGSIGGAG